MAGAGWYLDPSNPSRLRFWDGSAWQEQFSALPAAGPRPGFIVGLVVAAMAAFIALGILLAVLVVGYNSIVSTSKERAAAVNYGVLVSALQGQSAFDGKVPFGLSKADLARENAAIPLGALDAFMDTRVDSGGMVWAVSMGFVCSGVVFSSPGVTSGVPVCKPGESLPTSRFPLGKTPESE